MAKNTSDKSSKTAAAQPMIDLPQSYRLQPDIADIGSTVSKSQQPGCDDNSHPNDSNSSNSQAVPHSKFRKRWNSDKSVSQKLPQTPPPEDTMMTTTPNPLTYSCISSQTQSSDPLFTFITQPKIESIPGVTVPGASLSIPPPSISDHVLPNFQSVYPEMTSAFM